VKALHLSTMRLRHTDFGGVTSASHLVCYRNIGVSGSIPIPCVPCVLRHILNPAEKGDDEGAFFNLPNPPAVLQGLFVRAPIIHEGLLRQEGLFDVHWPALLIARPCVYKPSRWATGHLSAKEWLRAFDSPLSFDPVFLDNSRVRELLGRCLSPSVVSVIFGALWSDHTGGGSTGGHFVREPSTAGTKARDTGV
jgi:hypothetical protein